MLKKIKFLKDFRCFNKDEVFEFKPNINLLVGDQGSGKSSLIYLLREYGSNRKSKNIIEVEGDEIQSFSFCFEKDNPRQQSSFGAGDITDQVICRFISHGQTNLALLKKLNEEKNVLFILDEPDCALSIRSCYNLIKIFKSAVNNGCQIIASIHNPIIISEFNEVLNLETKKWMSSFDFIENQKS